MRLKNELIGRHVIVAIYGQQEADGMQKKASSGKRKRAQRSQSADEAQQTEVVETADESNQSLAKTKKKQRRDGSDVLPFFPHKVL